MANTLNLGDGNWATKKDSLLGYNSENNNYKPLPFDFSRGSSATRVNKDGLIETVGNNVPRIDYKDDSKGALLLEPSRSNLITYSEQLDNTSGWINQLNGTVVGGQIGVGNSLSAWKLNKGVGTFKSLRFQSSLSSANYTLSWYLKKGSLDIAEFRFDGGLGAQFIDFNLSTGIAGTNNNLTNIKMELIDNDWYRCQASCNSTITNVHLYIGDASSETQEGYIYAQTPQMEIGSYATSYIPTQGGVETRLADSCNNDFSVISTVANTNTVVLKFIPMGFDVDFAELLRFSDGTNEIALEGFSTNNYDMYGSGLTSSGMIDGALSLDAGSINTISFSYSGTSLRFSHNGSTINTVAPTGNLPTITEVSHSVGVLSPIKILDLRVYNDFKTQEELNTLTI